MRELFIKLLIDLVPAILDLKQLVNRVHPGSWQDVPLDASHRNAANVLVDLALARGWAEALAAALAEIAPDNFELQTLRDLLQARTAPTTVDPYREVLLESDRPFVARDDLRDQLKLLCSGGSTTLLVDGQPKTGKSHSFYFAQHVARTRGFVTSQFAVKEYPQPDKLAAELLDRIGVNATPIEIGVETAHRWGDKLAAQVADAIGKQKLPRMFVFDEFPPEGLPPGTAKLIVRLAKFADEELRPFLRLVLIQFNGELPSTLDDVAERDLAMPFTDSDLLAALRQVATARGWSLSELALQAEIAALEKEPDTRLRAGFRFLRTTIRKLGKTPAGGSP